jgi:hypothetical protein
MSTNSVTIRYAILLMAVFWLLIVPSQAQKNDTIFLSNGDRLTGELKKFEYGLLFLKTDAMQTVNIEFDRISTMYSAKQFEIRSTSGLRYFGSLMNSKIPGTVNILTVTDTVPRPMWSIVQITSIKNQFFQRIDGSVSMGLSYTKATDVFQYNLSTTATYRTTNYSTTFNLSSIISEDNNDLSRNNDVGLSVTRFFKGKWFATVQAIGQQNSELDLDQRIQTGLGGGYDIVRNNSQRLSATTGLLANRERTIEESLESTNIELLLNAQYKWFRYSHPKIDISSGFNVFPSLTTSGRIRLEYDLSSKIEILKDLFFDLTIYDNFDSVSSGSSSKNDWGIITSLGYSF